MAKAKAAGDKPTATEREAYARELTNGSHGYADMEALSDKLHDDKGNPVASAIQGFTANFGDELVGLLPKFLGGGDNGKEEMRLRMDMQRREHPVADMVTQGAGAVTSALLLPELKLAEGAPIAARALAGGRMGAMFGAANGVGSGEDATSRAIGGAAGAVGGAILGEAAPKLAATTAGQAVTKAIARILPARTPFELPPNNAPVTQVTSRLEQVSAGIDKAIHQMGGYGRARAANKALADAGRGDISVLADLGKPLTDEAKFAANNSSSARTAISDVIDERGSGSTQRVIDDFKNVVGDVHAPTREAELAGETRAWAEGPDGYGGIRDKNPTVPLGDAEKLVTQPRVKNLWKEAKETGQVGLTPELAGSDAMDKLIALNPKIDGKAWEDLLVNPDVVAQLRAAGKGHLIDALNRGDGHSFDNVQDLMHSLQDASTSAFASGKNNLGFKMKESAGLVQKTLEDHIPGYADIADKYAQRKSLEAALDDGTKWFHKANDITGLNKKVASLTPEQLDQFRHGVASEQLIQLQGSSGSNQATKTMIARNNPARTNMLKVVFGDEPTFDAFMTKAKAERQLGKLGDAVGGSSTHFNEANAASHDNLAKKVLEHGTHLSVSHRVQNAVVKAVLGPMREKQANAMTPHLLTKGTAAIDALLDFYEAAGTKNIPDALSKELPALGGSLFHQPE